MSTLRHFSRLGSVPANAWKAPHRAPQLPSHALLTEIYPATLGDAPAAFGFALGWALMQAKDLVLWAMPDHLEGEYGFPYAEGLAQFGANLERVLFVRAPSQAEAIWAAEQALNAPGALALCVIPPSPKALDLAVTRRLLLFAQKHQSRCALVRLGQVSPSVAHLRFSVRGAPSEGVARELGAPTFDVRLTRNRTGPAGHGWRLVWNSHDCSFIAAKRTLDGDMAQPILDRPTVPRFRGAV